MSIGSETAHLLGKQVIVTLSEHPDKVVAKGKLLASDEWGEIRLLDDMGGIIYCWPMLSIKEDKP